MKNMTKILPCRFNQSFGPFNTLTVHQWSYTGLFRHLSNPISSSLKFQKEITSEGHPFFQSIPNFMYISEMRQKTQKIFFNLEIMGFELVALNTHFYWEIILFIGYHMLTNSLKISDTTKTEPFEPVFCLSDQKLWQKHCRADLTCLSDSFTSWPSISFLTRGF